MDYLLERLVQYRPLKALDRDVDYVLTRASEVAAAAAGEGWKTLTERELDFENEEVGAARRWDRRILKRVVNRPFLN